jgi:uncharacterized protein YjaZ
MGASLALLCLMLVGCANVVPHVPERVQAARGRFAVSITQQLMNEFAGHGMNLQTLAEADLSRIGTLLPGPRISITFTVGDPDQILTSVGATGFTDPETGAITVGLYPYWSQEPPDFLPELARTTAREVDRSVRITAGAGLGNTILDSLITDGAATAFGQSAFPGPADPWVDALTAKQECQQWDHIKPVLSTQGIHDEVLVGGSVSSTVFGEATMPPLTGRAIGYHIVADYLAHAGSTNWATLAATPSKVIFRASGYSPCPSA